MQSCLPLPPLGAISSRRACAELAPSLRGKALTQQNPSTKHFRLTLPTHRFTCDYTFVGVTFARWMTVSVKVCDMFDMLVQVFPKVFTLFASNAYEDVT